MWYQEREGERKRKRKKRHTLTPWTHPDKDGTNISGMCPDRELNPKPFGTQNGAPTEPPSQGFYFIFYESIKYTY